jgi:hypothetical protein
MSTTDISETLPLPPSENGLCFRIRSLLLKNTTKHALASLQKRQTALTNHCRRSSITSLLAYRTTNTLF